MQAPVVEGRLFDGRTSRPQAVRLRAGYGQVVLERLDGGAPPERVPADALVWHEPLGALRRVGLPGGRVVELPSGAALAALLAACGHRERAVTRWQGSARRALLALGLLLAVGFAGYRWGLPLLAEGIAHALPHEAITAIDGHLLDTLDATGVLAPTTLQEARRADIRAAMAPLLAAREDSDPVTLHFRAAPAIGANAFALPGGDVVVTDALVELAPDAPHVAAVIAHELGHVAHRHGLRNLIQASVLATVIGAWTGDFSSLATAGATVVLGSAYSRDFEREADDYGAALLVRTGASPVLLADMLEALEKEHRGAEAAEEGDWSDYLSSHPSTPERIARLRGRVN